MCGGVENIGVANSDQDERAHPPMRLQVIARACKGANPSVPVQYEKSRAMPIAALNGHVGIYEVSNSVRCARRGQDHICSTRWKQRGAA
jgi:hypothetical protein